MPQTAESEPQVKGPLFIGVFAGGIVYADRRRKAASDYARCAFLPYTTLQVAFEKDCAEDLREAITSHAASIQARRGETHQVSSCGQTVVLGATSMTFDVLYHTENEDDCGHRVIEAGSLGHAKIVQRDQILVEGTHGPSYRLDMLRETDASFAARRASKTACEAPARQSPR